MLSANVVKIFSDSYMNDAMNNFTALTLWMTQTTILSIGGVNFTFMGVLLGINAFVIVAELIQRLFWVIK